MSIRLPDVRLDNGVFTYEEGIPVFIDTNGTRHYEIGKAQEKLFTSGMQFQKTLDAPLLNEKDRQITVLKDDVARVTQVAKDNFSLGQTLQAAKDQASIKKAEAEAYRSGCASQQAKDRAILEKVRMEAYREGRSDQAEEDFLKIDSAFQRGVSHNANQARELVVSLTSENIQLRRKIDHLGRCLATAHKVSELNLSPRSSKREFIGSTSQKFEKKEPLPLQEQDEDGPLGVVEQNSPNVVDDDSETNSIDPSHLEEDERLSWICEELKRNPAFPVPESFKNDIRSVLTNFCQSNQQGYPKIEKLLHALYALPKEVSLHHTLQLKVGKKEAVVLAAFRKALQGREQCSSFRLFLGKVVSHLEGKANRSLRAFINRERDGLYQTVSDCVADGVFDLGNKKLSQMITSYRKGDDVSEISIGLQAFAGRKESAMLARDRLEDLLRKDSALFPLLKEAVVIMAERYTEVNTRDIIELYTLFLSVNVPEEEVVSVLGVELAKRALKSPFPAKYLTPKLLEFWFDHDADESCFAALWKMIPLCSWENRELLKVCVSGIEQLASKKHHPTSIPNEQTIAALTHLSEGWSDQAFKLKLYPIGNALMFWWQSVRDEASLEQKIKFISAIGKGVVYYNNYTQQFINYLIELGKDLEERSKLKKFGAEFFINIFSSIHAFSVNKNPEVRNRLALLALSYWKGINFEYSAMQKYLLSSNTSGLYGNIVEILKDTDKSELITDIQRELSYHSMMAGFYRASTTAKTHLNGKLPEDFWHEIVQAMKGYLAEKPLNGDQQLLYTQFMTKARVVVTKQLIKALKPTTPKQLNGIIHAANTYLTQFESKYQDDPELKGYFKEMFLTVTTPEMNLDNRLESCQAMIKTQLPVNFWEDVRKEALVDLETGPCLLDYSLRFALFIANARVVVTRHLAEVLNPFDVNAQSQLIEGTNSVATSMEEQHKDNEKLKALRLQYFAIQARAALNGTVGAWVDYSNNTLDQMLGEFLKSNLFSVDELKQMAILTAQYGDDYGESVTVPQIARHIVNHGSLTHAGLASALIGIAMGYLNGKKEEQFILFVDEMKQHFTKSQLIGLVKQMEWEKEMESETQEIIQKLKREYHL